MSSIVQNMIQKSVGDGARPTKFDLLFQFTNNATAPSSDDIIAMTKATSFPGKSHEKIDFKYKGRNIPIKGQTKYSQTWECTFYLTEDHLLKNAFENWIEALDQRHNYMDVSTIPGLSETQKAHMGGNYTTTINLFQKNFNDDAQTAKYTMFNVFPTEVSPIQFDYSSQGQVQEFTVNFSYSYFTLETLKGKEGNFIDTLVGKFTDAAQNVVNGALSSLAGGINSFISDSAGDSLNKLNDWAKGLTTDIIPQQTQNTSRDLVSGGLDTSNFGASLEDAVEEQSGKALKEYNSIKTSVSNTIKGWF